MKGADPRLAEAHGAVSRRAWQQAYDLLIAVDAERGLEPADLEGMAKSAWWTGRAGMSIKAESVPTPRTSSGGTWNEPRSVSERRSVPLKGIAERAEIVTIAWR